ncbi:hypothetical protein QBC42DRAFT_311016 [Cladorrhinum samala]|uniref:F-box domain-containing protein n=1 Tax=Cladorrhinum samala TaxID=585594 RepID=A0AAV9HFS2_9PEZI|nr:hypothetical protein QBC42DRAFT_311016 [Cladorrhinum samala]
MTNPPTASGEISPAALKVIHTYELLTNILLHLDIRTSLTAAQRVSKTWHKIITTTPSIQRALFFLPDETSYPQYSHAPPQSRHQNPLLTELFPAWFDSSSPPPRTTVEQIPNTFSLEQFPSHRWEPFYSCAVAKNPRAFLHPTATWRRMLIAQPPVRELGFLSREITNYTAGGKQRTYHFYGPTTSSSAGGGPGQSPAVSLRPGYQSHKPRLSFRVTPKEEWEPDPKICTCLSRVPHKHLDGSPDDDDAAASSTLFSSPRNFPEVMIDGLRMGTLYDLVQHHSHEAEAETSWRILWHQVPREYQGRSGYEEEEEGYPDSHYYPRDDAFFWSGAHEMSAATVIPRPQQLRELFEWIPGGPVLQLFDYRPYNSKTTAEELKFQIAYRFPHGAGMSYARWWEHMWLKVGAGLKEFGTSMEEMERFEREVFGEKL